MTGYSIFDIAAWFLEKQAMEQWKLQYLCYYAFAWDNAIGDGNLITNCEFQAWPQGPVNIQLHSLLQENENNVVDFSYISGSKAKRISSHTDVEFLERVWATYGDYCQNALGAAVRSEIPWLKARTGLNPFEPSGNIISVQDISEFYRSIYAG